MKYANPTPPEGINSGGYRPLREFFVLTGAMLAVVALFVTAAFQFSQWVAPLVPFAWEREVEGPFVRKYAEYQKNHGMAQAELQRLVDRLVPHMDLPDGMSVQAYYSPDDTINALATVGGNIVVFQGLLDRLPSEDALAMVVAHEIAHVKNRDVLVSLGGNAIIWVTASALLGDVGSVGRLIDFEHKLSVLSYSRVKETRADRDALNAIVKVYGHGGGAQDLFEAFKAVEVEKNRVATSELMRSHPLNDNRIGDLRQVAHGSGWAMDGTRRGLAAPLRKH